MIQYALQIECYFIKKGGILCRMTIYLREKYYAQSLAKKLTNGVTQVNGTKIKKIFLGIFILLVTMNSNVFALEVVIPAYVDAKFTTNINLSKVDVYHENAGAVEFVFPMEEHLYKTICR